MSDRSSTSASLGPLADANEFHDPIALDSVEPDLLIAWLERMILIRRAEEAVGEMVERGEARCPCHLAIGQEAAAVGVAAAMQEGDVAFGAHRSHAHFLAMGGRPERLFAEILGRDSGCSRGMGGSMHLREADIGLVGTVPIVGATIPMTVGAALAAKLDGQRRVAISFFGDGATEEGVFHESLNLASVLQVPILFVCENNLFSSHLHISERQPYDSVARFAPPHRVEARTVDGNDVVAVWHATDQLLHVARTGRPALLEAVTYRWRGHVGHREDLDVGVDRNKELRKWQCRDPIGRLVRALENAGLIDSPRREQLEARALARIERSLRTAQDAPSPPLDLLLDSVLTGKR